MEISGKIAIVTGASRGVGKGVAQELGRAGMTVYVTGRSVVEGEAEMPGTIGSSASAVDAAGGQGIAVRCDHRDDAMVQTLFAQVEREQGRLDLLVNCASELPTRADRENAAGKRFWELGPRLWDTYHGVGVRSHYVASLFAARIMARQRGGLIVNISSAAACQYFHSVANGTAKAAVDKMTSDMATELESVGVAVISLWPGLVKTEMVLWMAAQGLIDASRAETPRFTGRCVVALLRDSEVKRHSGRALYVTDVARAYGFTDVDGCVPERLDLGSLQMRSAP